MNHPKTNELQQLLDEWQYFAPCLGANTTIYDSHYGYSNFSSGFESINPEKKIQPKKLFYIYSITKTFTAIVVMKLIESELVNLNDPIIKYIPYIKLPSDVTIKHLLNHTSGVKSYTDLPDYLDANRESPSSPWSFEYVLERTCNEKLAFHPGEKWHYSNTGYMLLLLMVESVTNQSFSKNIEKYIIKKMGLRNTYLAENIDNNITNGYCRYLNSNNEIENIKSIYNPWWCKTGLVVSTSEEITILYNSLFSGKLVNPNSLKMMMEAVSVGQDCGIHFKKPSYGLGIMIDPENDFGCSYGHGGDGAGFNTWSVYYPSFNGREVGVTVFCNTTMGGHPLYLSLIHI